jgi:hypothetical protein
LVAPLAVMVALFPEQMVAELTTTVGVGVTLTVMAKEPVQAPLLPVIV